MKINELPIELENLWKKELGMLNGMMTMQLEKKLSGFHPGVHPMTEEQKLEVEKTIETFTTKVLNAISKQ